MNDAENASHGPRAKQPETINDTTLTFWQADYELKITYLSNHFTRMWTRFNFFITLETGLSAALWVWLKEASAREAKIVLDPALGIAWIGFFGSLVWYMFGAQDRYLVESYRGQVRATGQALAHYYGISAYVSVGEPSTNVTMNLYQWRWKVFSTTKLAAWFPLLVCLYWVGMLLFLVRQ